MKNRIYVSKVKGVFTEGYIEVGEVLLAKFHKASELKTGSSEKAEPPTINKGVEIWKASRVRSNGTAAESHRGKACSVSTLYEAAGQMFGGNVTSSGDNGVTAAVCITPALL